MKTFLLALLATCSLMITKAEARNEDFWGKIVVTDECGSGSMCTNKGYICVIE